MIGFDQTMLAEGESKPSDTRERHIKYAKALRTHYPNGNIVVILRVPPSWSSQHIRIGEGLTVIPVPSRRSTFMVRALIILRELLRGLNIVRKRSVAEFLVDEVGDVAWQVSQNRIRRD